jgi:hypothetical protein
MSTDRTPRPSSTPVSYSCGRGLIEQPCDALALALGAGGH